MAGERIGKTYEAILKVALDLYRKKKQWSSAVFWNETPIGLTVEPDFLIGPDKDHPEILFMVTHSGSSKNSDMKCWRNIGELCESKSALSSEPIVVSVIFEGTMKAALKDLQEAAFDGQLIVSDRPYGQDMKRWVHHNEASLPTNQDEKAQAIWSLYKRDPAIKKMINSLTSDVEIACEHRKEALKRLWAYERMRPRGNAPESKITSVRRGTSKLMIFEDVDLAISLFTGKQIPNEVMPAYVYSLGLARKAIGRATPSDDEIKNAIAILDRDTIKELYNSMSDNDTVQAWVRQLRNISTLEVVGEYIKANYDALSDSDFLYQAIRQLEKNPDALVSPGQETNNWPPEDIWLVSYLLELFKADSDRANGYGIAQLAADVYLAGYGYESDASDAGQFGGGFGFSSWIMRKPSPFREDLIRGISHVFADKLKEVGKQRASQLIDNREVEKTISNNLIEAKLCTYRMYEPLYTILTREISGIRKEAYRTCFAEKAGLPGRTGKTTVAVVGHTIINWQTATDAGKDHKRKELCGRAVGLRYTWDADNECFTERPGIKKMVLLLDGTWNNKDLRALINAGWDEIFYPDEIDKLKAAIV